MNDFKNVKCILNRQRVKPFLGKKLNPSCSPKPRMCVNGNLMSRWFVVMFCFYVLA